jgi:hypothetical protein
LVTALWQQLGGDLGTGFWDLVRCVDRDVSIRVIEDGLRTNNLTGQRNVGRAPGPGAFPAVLVRGTGMPVSAVPARSEILVTYRYVLSKDCVKNRC